MPKKSSDLTRSWPLRPLNFARVTQISEAHCGPAVIQMLLANLGIEVTQEEVAELGGATELIDLHGMRVDQLALAVRLISPNVQFWYKDHAKLRELITLVKNYKYPVGVEWQGLFGSEDDDDDDDDSDYGHYSVVTHVDTKRKELIIVDPYKDFVSQDRIFSFDTFTSRWWDTNEITDPETGQERLVPDYHMMFIVTPKEATFPAQLGMKTA
jgi:hypothetical protein